MSSLSRLYRYIPVRLHVQHTRAYAAPTAKPRSNHGDFYSSMLPGMIPIALLGSAIYMGLQLVQGRLAHEKFLDEAKERIRTLQGEVDRLQKKPAPTISPSGSMAPSRTGSWWPWS